MSTMAGRRNPIRKGSINYNNFSSLSSSPPPPKGTRPTAEKQSMLDDFMGFIVIALSSYLMLRTKFRLCAYLGILFGVSIIGDVLPFPKWYLSQSNHFFNQYFVKLGWGWTLISTIPFILMTSNTHCCSNRKQLALLHLSRLGVATFFWFFWTNMFNYIESIYGRCSDGRATRRSKCLEAGLRWSGFDISGHSFILIYSVLLIIEEAKPIQGWLNIQIGLDTERHMRSLNEKSASVYKNLSLEEIDDTEKNYKKYRTIVCLNFIWLTVLCVIWDVMILTTAMYYHTMLEKVVAGLIAIITWYATYHFWYSWVGIPPMPCAGKFKYYERNGGFVASANGAKARK